MVVSELHLQLLARQLLAQVAVEQAVGPVNLLGLVARVAVAVELGTLVVLMVQAEL